LANGIGLLLRGVRQQWRLSLREVEERSLRFAQEMGNQSYHVSASWLNRLEREEHELTVSKLIVLASIYIFDWPCKSLVGRDFQQHSGVWAGQLSEHYGPEVYRIHGAYEFVWWEIGRIMTWNPGIEKNNGYTANEVLGQHYSMFFLPEDIKAHVPDRALARALKYGRYSDEGWRIRKNGERFWASFRYLKDAQPHR
jgi:PAS domain-containing protein